MFFRFLKTLYHICWYGIAGLIILAAISITLFRMVLPDIGHYREDIQIWISDYMGYPVQIRSINASWEGWVPNLYLQDISVINEDSNEPLIRFDHASITLDPVSSLKQREFIPYDINVSGMDLSLIRHQDGSISLVRADAAAQTPDAGAGENELGRWFRKQKHIEIDKVDIQWIDHHDNLSPVLFSDASIRIHSDGDRMQVSGSAHADQELGGTDIEFALDIHGHLHTSEWSGAIYINADNVNPRFWSDHFKLDTVELNNGGGQLQIWSQWERARLVKLDGLVSWESLHVNGYPLNGINGQVHVARNRNDDWLANIEIREFTTATGIWPALTAEITLPSGKTSANRFIHASVDYLKIEDLTGMLGRYAIMDVLEPDKATLSGELFNTQLKLSVDDEVDYIWVDSDFSHLTLRRPDHYSVADLSGHITIDNDSRIIHLESEKSRILLPEYYRDPLWFYNLNGDITWKNHSNGIEIRIDSLNGKTSDFDFSLISKLETHADNDIMIDLLANISPVSTARIMDYIPQTGKTALVKWLRNSLSGGRFLHTDIVMRGPLSRFPFANNEGTLQVITQVEKLTVDYNPDWPPVDNLATEVTLNNNTLEVVAESGNIFSSVLSDTTAIIPDITAEKPLVLLKGEINGTARDMSLFVNQSPLHTTHSLLLFSNEDLQGPIRLDLELGIPLKGGDKTINGRLHLSGNKLDSRDFGIALDDLRGTIDFTGKTIASHDLEARYFNRDITLAINKTGQQDNGSIRVDMRGTMDREFLRKQFNHYFPYSRVMMNEYIDHFTGSSSWLAQLAISEDVEDTTGSQLHISSDLVGMEVDLPAPLAKEKDLPLPIRIRTALNDIDKQQLDFQIGQVLAARLEYSEDGDNVIDALRVNFGGELQNLTSATGIQIGGQLGEVSLSEWVNLIKENMQANPETSTNAYDNIHVDVGITYLEFFNQLFTDVSLEVTKPANDWQINVDSESISGLISIPSGENVIVLDMNRLRLQENIEDEDNKPVVDIDPNRMPSIHAHVKNVIYGNKVLGEMYLETSRLNNGLSFDELTFTKTDLDINGFGKWVWEQNRSISSFTFDIKAKELNDMLGTFGFSDAAVSEGRTSINIEADWVGRPVDFSLDAINGQLEMQIEKGRFLNINPRAGRLFGLLSLQTLPRRLALDFTDVFGKGLSFDTIKGVFTIENGNAYTNDLVMIGPSANIAITGRTGLIEKDYDQVVTVTPQISNSLPVASALFGPIGVGVGAVIYFAGELFKSIPDQIDRILQYQYTITGSWEDPEVKELQERDPSRQASG